MEQVQIFKNAVGWVSSKSASLISIDDSVLYFGAWLLTLIEDRIRTFIRGSMSEIKQYPHIYLDDNDRLHEKEGHIAYKIYELEQRPEW